ncbi:hypothetical protein KA531_03395 [Candidatus Saccharibacteria bacterium]|nr:hypothetical protein [Candidatus Saccharibacteria bacterium]
MNTKHSTKHSPESEGRRRYRLSGLATLAMLVAATVVSGCSANNQASGTCSSSPEAQVPKSQETVNTDLLASFARFLKDNPEAFDNQDPKKLLGLDLEELGKVSCEDLKDEETNQLTELGQKLNNILIGYRLGLSIEEVLEADRLGVSMETIRNGMKLGIPYGEILLMNAPPKPTATMLD